MAETRSSKMMDLLLFAVSLAAMILLLMFQPAWFWVALPFVLTYLVRFFEAM